MLNKEQHKIRIAIAKYIGWKREKTGPTFYKILTPHGHEVWHYDSRGNSYGPACSWESRHVLELMPDYPNDLNAMNIIEKKLTHEQRKQYVAYINGCDNWEGWWSELTDQDKLDAVFKCTNASALIKADAFIQTLKLK